MKLNFYYEIPTPGSIAGNTCHLVAAERFLNLCKNTYPDIEFNYINSWGITYENGLPTLRSCPGCKFSHFFVIIENPDNKKFFVISYWDSLKDITLNGTFWDLENCVGIFPSAGTHTDNASFKPIDLDYTPIAPLTIHKSLEDKAQELYLLNVPKTTPDTLFFRGGNNGFREYLANNDKRFIINHERIDTAMFAEEMAKNTINIDINAVAEISGRTIDAMALGTALIRPKLSIKYHNPLIPDYHYAEVKCEDLSNWPRLADAYVERFEELKKDKELVRFLSENGRKWYEENATIDAHVNILKKVINLKKLI
jgi:hypothetical protein